MINVEDFDSSLVKIDKFYKNVGTLNIEYITIKKIEVNPLHLIISGIHGFTSEEGKNKEREHGRNKYHNMSKEKKQKLK